jgi:hypothetical protein
MQNLRDIEHDSLSASLDAIGGEPLAGSGFEAGLFCGRTAGVV